MKSLFLIALCACGSKPAPVASAPVAQHHHQPRHADVAPAPPEQPIDPLLVIERDPSATYADPHASTHFVTVVAELGGTRFRQPQCGIIHGGTVLDYKVIAVESGTLIGERFLAAAGCIEWPREAYDANAGTLDAFRTGELHRLVLSNDLSDSRGMSFIQTEPAFVIVSADPA